MALGPSAPASGVGRNTERMLRAMAIPHARPGQAVEVQPLGTRLAQEKTVALFKSEDPEVMRVVLLRSRSLPPHSVPGEITIQCIEGASDVTADGRSHVLQAGQLLYLAGGVTQGVTALQDSSALVTVALRKQDAARWPAWGATARPPRALRPTLHWGRLRRHVTLQSGLMCRAEGPNGAVLVSDMPKGVGGGGSAPAPGWLLRASLANCDTTGIAMRAAQLGVALTRLEVTVESLSDDRGMFGPGADVPPGSQSTRVRVAIASSEASADRLREIVRSAERHSPVGDAIRRAIPASMAIEIS